MNLSVLYRGPLSSCNYCCGYCPFAKRSETAAQLARDRQSLARFYEWLRRQSAHRWRVMFTPWGEALTRAWYRKATAALTRLPHVDSVAVQTNLSCGLEWLANCRLDRLTLWTTYHPTETDRERFFNKIEQLRSLHVRVSVGMVGAPELAAEIQAVRRLLPDDVYLWINAQQPRPRPYSAAETALFQAIDPHFELMSRRQPSLGKACRTGETSFTVDGNGEMRRCHFVDEAIGNIYDEDWEQALQPRMCPRRYCDCFLGKAQLQAESLALFFGPATLERLPHGSGGPQSTAALPHIAGEPAIRMDRGD